MSESLTLRIKMPHEIKAAAVTFFCPHAEANAHAVFEEELRRIVAEEVAKAAADSEAQIERMRAITEAALKEKADAVRERAACHDLFDQVIRLCGHNPGGPRPMLVDAVRDRLEAVREEASGQAMERFQQDDIRNLGSVRARAVGCVVHLEYIGRSQIVSWGCEDDIAADNIAGEINAVLNGMRAVWADGCHQAGTYANWANKLFREKDEQIGFRDEEIAGLRKQLEEAQAEIGKYQRQILNHCHRIAEQSDALSRAAGKDAAGRLDAWREGREHARAEIDLMADGWRVHLFAVADVGVAARSQGLTVCGFMPHRYSAQASPTHRYYFPSNQPASLPALLRYALDTWAELYPSAPTEAPEPCPVSTMIGEGCPNTHEETATEGVTMTASTRTHVLNEIKAGRTGCVLDLMLTEVALKALGRHDARADDSPRDRLLAALHEGRAVLDEMLLVAGQVEPAALDEVRVG